MTFFPEVAGFRLARRAVDFGALVHFSPLHRQHSWAGKHRQWCLWRLGFGPLGAFASRLLRAPNALAVERSICLARSCSSVSPGAKLIRGSRLVLFGPSPILPPCPFQVLGFPVSPDSFISGQVMHYIMFWHTTPTQIRALVSVMVAKAAASH